MGVVGFNSVLHGTNFSFDALNFRMKGVIITFLYLGLLQFFVSFGIVGV